MYKFCIFDVYLVVVMELFLLYKITLHGWSVKNYKNCFSYFAERIFPYHPVTCPTCGKVMQTICSDLQCIIITMQGVVILVH